MALILLLRTPISDIAIRTIYKQVLVVIRVLIYLKNMDAKIRAYNIDLMFYIEVDK